MLNKILNHLNDVKVKDIKSYNLSGQKPFYDYFVIGSCNRSQAQAVLTHLHADSSLNDIYSEGLLTDWVLIQVDMIVIHLFIGDSRNMYALDEDLTPFIIE